MFYPVCGSSPNRRRRRIALCVVYIIYHLVVAIVWIVPESQETAYCSVCDLHYLPSCCSNRVDRPRIAGDSVLLCVVYTIYHLVVAILWIVPESQETAYCSVCVLHYLPSCCSNRVDRPRIAGDVVRQKHQRKPLERHSTS